MLHGGNASGAVVRVGDTVRKPWQPSTPRVVEFMDALREAGIDVPRTYGADEQGRLVLEFVPGTMAIDLAPLPLDTLTRVGALVRRIHDASARLPVPEDWQAVVFPAPYTELLCHHDLATWNLVVDGDRLVFIDWDAAGPSSRSWDLAYSALTFAHLVPGAEAEACVRRLTAFVDGYGADPDLRTVLPDLMVQRAQAMWELLHSSHLEGREPWGTMYADGHGDYWSATTDFIAQHRRAWVDALTP